MNLVRYCLKQFSASNHPRFSIDPREIHNSKLIQITKSHSKYSKLLICTTDYFVRMRHLAILVIRRSHAPHNRQWGRNVWYFTVAEAIHREIESTLITPIYLPDFKIVLIHFGTISILPLEAVYIRCHNGAVLFTCLAQISITARVNSLPQYVLLYSAESAEEVAPNIRTALNVRAIILCRVAMFFCIWVRILKRKISLS